MNPSFRTARIDDVGRIVEMLADDFLGTQRENLNDQLASGYKDAFREIDSDPNNELIVCELDGEVTGTMQLTYTPSLSYQGSRRCTVESVRVDAKCRGQGIGRAMMLWAIERAREKGCRSIQLTTHKDRIDAHRFYENLGFVGSHLGMKLSLD